MIVCVKLADFVCSYINMCLFFFCSGYVTRGEFLAALDLPQTPITEQVFHLFDKQDRGSINFREV